MFRIKEWRERGASAGLNIMFKEKQRACLLCLVSGIIFNILDVEGQYFLFAFPCFSSIFLGVVHYSQYDEEAGREDKEEVRGSLEE